MGLFSLAVYIIEPTLFDGEFKPLDFSRALEQYLIFTLNPSLNIIKVAGIPLPQKSKKAKNAHKAKQAKQAKKAKNAKKATK